MNRILATAVATLGVLMAGCAAPTPGPTAPATTAVPSTEVETAVPVLVIILILVVLGATEAYEARCRLCYDPTEPEQPKLLE